MKYSTYRLPVLTLRTLLLVFAVALLAGSCVESYLPPQTAGGKGFLVVDGFLNLSGPTTFRLSRSQNLLDPERPPAESQAVVTVEADGGGQYRLDETPTGVYTLAGTPFGAGQQYRLRIRTRNGEEYLSDFVEARKTPPVESVDWTAGDDGVQISVTTRDPQNNTRYYRWEYEETWEFTVPHVLAYYLNRGVREPITENIVYCWKENFSKNILLGTSARLSEDYIYRFPLTFMPPESEKHRIRYSILVKQVALTKEGFEYWQNLRKNTETLGSLFDPQPSQLTSNIRSVNDPDDPEDQVFGFFSAYSVEEKRIFIRAVQLPNWRRVTGYETCQLDTFPIGLYPASFFQNSKLDVVDETRRFGVIVGYITSRNEYCSDCRVSGSNKKPSFW